MVRRKGVSLEGTYMSLEIEEVKSTKLLYHRCTHIIFDVKFLDEL